MARLYEQYILPSNGALDGIPKEVTIQNMTTAEEKTLIGSSEELYDTLITRCVTKPDDFDFGNLTMADQQFLLIRIRSMSYGNEYPYMYRCPSCGNVHEYMIDLDGFELTYLPDTFSEPYETVTLPVSGDTIGLRLPRVHEVESIENKARRYMKKHPGTQGDIAYIYQLMLHIGEIELKDDKTGPKKANVPVRGDMTQYFSESQLQNYVENMHVKDASMIRNKINKMDKSFGYDRTVYDVCPNCQSDVEFQWVITGDFFRTRFGE